jgi:hypothetical protein
LKKLHLIAVLIAGALLLVAVFAASASSKPKSAIRPKACPVWYENAPPLGRGVPHAVRTKGLLEVVVCRYLGAFGGGGVVHHPPLKSNFVSAGTLTGQRKVRNLARGFDRYPRILHPKKEIFSCPPGGEGGFYVVFFHAGGYRESVNLKPGECQTFIAGRHGKLTFIPWTLLKRMTKIAPPYRAAHP